MQPEQLEQLFTITENRRRFTLGLPKGDSAPCPRVLLTPEGVSMLASQGIEVMVEKGYGDTIQYVTQRYAQARASIVSEAEARNCDVVIDAAFPTADSARRFKPHGVLLTLLNNRHIAADAARILLERRVTVIALDRITDHRRLCPVADILGEVSGRAAIAAATSFMVGSLHGKGILLGGVAGVNPCEVIILGTGMSALAAARSAIGLGAMVRMFDSDPYCLRTAVTELGAGVIGSALHPTVLGHALGVADVVIATRLQRGFAIDESVLSSMKKGVVIIDLNDQYGLSVTFPTLECTDVSQALSEGINPGSDRCFINPAGCVQRTAAMALTNDIVPVVDRLFGTGHGIVNVLKTDPGLRNAVLFFGGRLVNREIGNRLGFRSVDINLLLTFS